MFHALTWIAFTCVISVRLGGSLLGKERLLGCVDLWPAVLQDNLKVTCVAECRSGSDMCLVLEGHRHAWGFGGTSVGGDRCLLAKPLGNAFWGCGHGSLGIPGPCDGGSVQDAR